MAITPDSIRRGTVVLVRLAGGKAQSAVVVRSDLLAELSHATILPIASEIRDGVGFRIDLAPDGRNGSRLPSQIMVDWAQTVHFSDMGQAIGHLDPAIMRPIARQTAIVLGFGR